MTDVMPGSWEDSSFGVIAGRVQSLSAEPLEEALISVRQNEESGRRFRQTLSNERGEFRIDSVSPGRGIVRIELLGYQTQDHHINVVAGAQQGLCAILQPY
jgi:hypothetical protein